MLRIRLAGLGAFALAVLFAAAAFAQSQGEMNDAACQEYKKADTDLTSTITKIRTAYKDDAVFLDKLEKAQKAWMAFRDAQLEAVYPAADKDTEYGSVYPMCRCSALTELTTQRIEQLKRWIDGVEEGDVCAGSVRAKEE